MSRDREVQDPYAPPPPRKDKSGRFLRYALVAAMLGAGAYGYMEFSKGGATLSTPAEQQVADANYTTTPEAIPQAVPEATTAPTTAPPAATQAPAAAPVAPREPTTPPAG